MRQIILILLIFNIYSCSQQEKNKKIVKEELEGIQNDESLQYVESFLKDMNSAKTLDDAREFFYKYYYEPYEIIDGELVNIFIRDFKMIWEDVRNVDAPFIRTAYTTLHGQDILDSPYALILLNNVKCDDCVVLLPKKRKDWYYQICIKEGKIYSTIGTYDLDKEEYIWYRDKKHPPMRFN